jgi:hypothetical protein
MSSPGIVASAGKGGGGGGAWTWVRSAVHWDGASFLRRGAGLLGVTDSPRMSASWWINGGLPTTSAPVFATSAPSGNAQLMSDGRATTGGTRTFAMFGAFAAVSGFITFDSQNSDMLTNLNTVGWHHIAAACDVTTGSPLFSMFVDGVSVASNETFGGSGFNIGIAEETDFFVANDGSGSLFTGDMADLQLWFGTYIDFTVASNLHLFRDAGGNPIDPHTAEAAFGTPAVLLAGDHTMFGVNRGSGGAFALTGSLTDAGSHP